MIRKIVTVLDPASARARDRAVRGRRTARRWPLASIRSPPIRRCLPFAMPLFLLLLLVLIAGVIRRRRRGLVAPEPLAPARAAPAADLKAARAEAETLRRQLEAARRAAAAARLDRGDRVPAIRTAGDDPV